MASGPFGAGAAFRRACCRGGAPRRCAACRRRFCRCSTSSSTSRFRWPRAAAIRRRFAEAFPAASAAAIAAATDEVLAGCGLSRPKAKAVRAVASAVLDGALTLDRHPRLTEDAIRAEMRPCTESGRGRRRCGCSRPWGAGRLAFGRSRAPGCRDAPAWPSGAAGRSGTGSPRRTLEAMAGGGGKAVVEPLRTRKDAAVNGASHPCRTRYSIGSGTVICRRVRAGVPSERRLGAQRRHLAGVVSCPRAECRLRPLSYYTLSLWCWQDAVKAVFLDRVNILSEYDQVVRSPSFEFRLPSVVSLKTFVKPASTPPFTRFQRFPARPLHLPVLRLQGRPDVRSSHPRSRGGKTTWLNVVTACSRAISARAGICPAMWTCGEQHALPPDGAAAARQRTSVPANYLHESWQDFLYWDTELDP